MNLRAEVAISLGGDENRDDGSVKACAWRPSQYAGPRCFVPDGRTLKHGGEAKEAVRVPVNQVRTPFSIVEPNTVTVGPSGGHEASHHGQERSGSKHGASLCQGDLELTNKPASGFALEGNTYDSLQPERWNPGYMTHIYAASRQVAGVKTGNDLDG